MSLNSNGTFALRPWLLALVAFGLTGTTTELVLLEHYEEATQIFPLVVMGVTLLVIGVHAVTGTRSTLILLRALMLVLVVTGLVGMALHFRGNMEFQLEMDATQAGWPLLRKILHAKTPPALAPGAMSQLGLLGFLYTYRHPVLLRQPVEPGR